MCKQSPYNMVLPNWYQNIMWAAIVRTLNGVSYKIVGDTKELFGTLFMKVLKMKKKGGRRGGSKGRGKYQIRGLRKMYFILLNFSQC